MQKKNQYKTNNPLKRKYIKKNIPKKSIKDKMNKKQLQNKQKYKINVIIANKLKSIQFISQD